MSEEKLQNPFDRPSDGFLAFSASTPTNSPAQKNFVPKRGKANGQDNWKRFGNEMAKADQDQVSGSQNQQQQQQSQAYFYSSPQNNQQSFRGYDHSSNRGHNFPRGQFSRGSPSNFRGSPNNFRGGGFNRQDQHFNSPNHRRGQNHRNRGGQNEFRSPRNSSVEEPISSYIHPSMTEDPWAMLEKQHSFEQEQIKMMQEAKGEGSNQGQQQQQKQMLSESLIPQIGDSFYERRKIDPAPDVAESFSTASSSSMLNSAADNENDITEDSEGMFDSSRDGLPKMVQSDSMIPLVGDTTVMSSEDVDELKSVQSETSSMIPLGGESSNFVNREEKLESAQRDELKSIPSTESMMPLGGESTMFTDKVRNKISNPERGVKILLRPPSGEMKIHQSESMIPMVGDDESMSSETTRDDNFHSADKLKLLNEEFKVHHSDSMTPMVGDDIMSSETRDGMNKVITDESAPKIKIVQSDTMIDEGLSFEARDGMASPTSVLMDKAIEDEAAIEMNLAKSDNMIDAGLSTNTRDGMSKKTQDLVTNQSDGGGVMMNEFIADNIRGVTGPVALSESMIPLVGESIMDTTSNASSDKI